MQTQKFFAVLLTLFLGSASCAQQPSYSITNNNLKLPGKETSFKVSVLPDANSGSFIVVIQNPEKKKLQLQIFHDVLGTAVDTTLRTEKFTCRYNLNEPDDGRYNIIVASGKE
jgi:hypothetical protein